MDLIEWYQSNYSGGETRRGAVAEGPTPNKCLLEFGAWMGWLFGMVLVNGLYSLIGYHFYIFIEIICPLLKKRFGTNLGLLWIAIGLTLVYNIVYNHFLAMIIKSGSPSDLKKIEEMRLFTKNRPNRKSVEQVLDNDKEQRFEGLSSDVKRLLRYRQKTVA